MCQEEVLQLVQVAEFVLLLVEGFGFDLLEGFGLALLWDLSVHY